MADISLTCTKCSHVMTISEFVDDSALTCPECGEPLGRPAAGSGNKKKRRVTVSSRQYVPEEEAAPPEGTTRASDLWPGGKHAPRAPRRAKVRHHLYGWLLFAVLACAMYFLRFGDVLATEHVDLMKKYAVWVAIALHILTVLKAFEDSIFQGILCLLIPFYTLYYILCVTDSVYFRSTVCGLLVGFGWDAGIVLQERFFTICEFVRAWIARGG